MVDLADCRTGDNGDPRPVGNVSKRDHRGQPGGWVFVDGSSVGDIGPAALRDREVLSQDGFVLAVVRLDGATGRLLDRPRIITRGFVFVKDNVDLIERAEEEIIAALLNGKDPQTTIRKALSELLHK